MTPLAISDATFWSVTFDDTRSVDYNRNSFIIQATGLIFVGKGRSTLKVVYSCRLSSKEF